MLTVTIIIWICAVLFISGFTQGLTGFGFAVIGTPLLSLALPVQIAVPVSVLCGGMIAAPIVVTLRRHILWKPLLVLLLGAAPGIWLGARLLSAVPAEWIIGAMGAILTALGIFQLCNGRVPAAWRGLIPGAICGFLSGAIGASTAAPGPPVIAYTSVQPWDVRETKSVMNVLFLLMSITLVPIYGTHDLLTRNVALTCAWGAPAALAGLAAGLWLSHILRNRVPLMRRIIYAAVLLLGLSMLAKALWH